jgi:hypothetical protein
MLLFVASLFSFCKVSQACSGFLLITDFLRVLLSLFLSVLIAAHLEFVASIVSSLQTSSITTSTNIVHQRFVNIFHKGTCMEQDKKQNKDPRQYVYDRKSKQE